MCYCFRLRMNSACKCRAWQIMKGASICMPHPSHTDGGYNPQSLPSVEKGAVSAVFTLSRCLTWEQLRKSVSLQRSWREAAQVNGITMHCEASVNVCWQIGDDKMTRRLNDFFSESGRTPHWVGHRCWDQQAAKAVWRAESAEMLDIISLCLSLYPRLSTSSTSFTKTAIKWAHGQAYI